MGSMYVTIMDLPLFKGITNEHVSAFLERTKLEFVKYLPGATIHRQYEKCQEMRYIISGRVGLLHTHISNVCTVSEELQAGNVIGADRLFGMNTTYVNTAFAIDEVCIMKFSKEKYLELLASDEIYIINILNYLSLRAQRAVDSLHYVYSGKLLGHLAYWVESLTERDSKNITVNCTIDALQTLTNINSLELESQIMELKKKRLAVYSSDTFTVPSRQKLIEAALEDNRY